MPVRLSIEVDTKPIERVLGDLHTKQVPFATAKALNKTANDVQQAIRATLPGKFTLRRKTFIERTVKIENKDRATKTKPSVRVAIDPTRDFLAKFEEDRRKRPTSGKTVAVPVDARPGKDRIVPKRLALAALQLRRTSRFGKGRRVLVGKDGILVVDGMVLQKTKRTVKKSRGGFARTREQYGGKVRLLYLLRREVKIRPVLRFKETANATVSRVWEKNMGEAVALAIATAK